MRVFGALAVLVALAIPVLSLTSSQPGLFGKLFRLWAPLLAFVAVWPLATTFGVAWIASWSRAGGGRFGPQRCTIRHGILTVHRSTGTESQIQLGRRIRYSEALAHCLVFENPWSPEVVPIAAFRSAEDHAQFRTLVEAAAA